MIAQQREAAASGVNTSPVLGVLTGGNTQVKGQETGKGGSEGTILMSDAERQQLQQQMQQVCIINRVRVMLAKVNFKCFLNVFYKS